MEYLDVVDETGRPTGESVSRDRAHSEGIRHRTAHVWVVRQSKSGFDVLDFRGGASLSIFSSDAAIRELAQLNGVKSVIAHEYDDYKAARRKGYTPIEALEDWDLLDEEAKNCLMNKR